MPPRSLPYQTQRNWGLQERSNNPWTCTASTPSWFALGSWLSEGVFTIFVVLGSVGLVLPVPGKGHQDEYSSVMGEHRTYSGEEGEEGRKERPG